MPRAVRLVTDWVFSTGFAGLAEIRWECVAGNAASAAVARKTGFTFTGVRPAEVPARDGSHPESWHGVLRKATEPSRSRAGRQHNDPTSANADQSAADRVPSLEGWVDGAAGDVPVGVVGDDAAVWAGPFQDAGGDLSDPPAGVVFQPVVALAQARQIVRGGFAAVVPVEGVVDLGACRGRLQVGKRHRPSRACR